MNGVCDRSSAAQYDPGMRPRPQRLDRLPQQYFVGLLGRVAAAAAADGEPLVDLGRGNPETGPPPHVVEALREAVLDPAIHGYSPIRGLPQTKEAIAGRYRDVYGVELDPETEVAVIPGTKTAIVELALSLCDEGDTLLLPDPYYPDYPSGPALAGARLETVPLRPDAGLGARPRRRAGRGSAVSQLSLESLRRLCARRRLRGRRRLVAPNGRGSRPRRCIHRHRVRRPANRRAFWRRPARKTSASRCGRCRRPTGWRAGASASSSATPRSWSGSTCSTITAASASSRRCSRRRSPRSRARRTRSPSGSPRTSAGATRSRPRSRTRPSARERSTSGSSCRTGSPPKRCSPSTASSSRPARASGRAVRGGCAFRSPSTTSRSSSAPSVSQRAFAAVAGAAH